MATDLTDYSQAVNVVGGSVSITGTATVVISGTPAVTISGTPNVAITNTPAVTISGTPSVTIAAGSAAIGSVTLGAGANLIGSVSGTVSIGNTPSVTISSGSVTIANASIAVINSTGTLISSKVQPVSIGSITFLVVGGPQNLNFPIVIPAGTHAVGVVMASIGQINSVTLLGNNGTLYFPLPGNPAVNLATRQSIIIPVDSIQDSGTYQLTGTNPGGAQVTVGLTAYLDPAAVWVQNTSQSPLSVLNTSLAVLPNLLPVGFQFAAGGGNAVVRAGVVGQRIYVFCFQVVFDAVAAGQSMTLKDAAGGTIFAYIGAAALNPAAFEGHGVALALGNALATDVPAGANARGAVGVSQG